MPQQSAQAPPKPAVDGRRRIDLSVAQVAASALATVAGAVLASGLGVYGTIIGAAVVSVGATVGGAVFQHLFKRTGEHLRGAVDPQPEPVAEISSDWNAPRTVRAKRRWTWKTYAAVSALVFAVAMTPILVVEVAAGKPLHDITTGRSGSGTSLNPGGRTSPAPSVEPSGSASTGPPAVPSTSPSATPSGSPSSSPSASTSPSPSPSVSGSPSPTATPTTTPTGSSGDAATSSATPPTAAPTP
ncbi:hypothetical protein [Kitasatospora atroaurantiaca]|nr:hypothetical protein [Kitasatospora atroaurantiaca]